MNKKVIFISIGVVLSFILLLIISFAGTNNRAISLEEQIISADADIRVQEKRRTDLIYNLVDCVKEYDKHEAETLLAVISERKNNSDPDISNYINQISVVAEDYPELKSSDNYKQLMTELAITENNIAQYRKTYNNQIREYNKYVRKFPHKQILSMLGYNVIDYDYIYFVDDDVKEVKFLFEKE